MPTLITPAFKFLVKNKSVKWLSTFVGFASLDLTFGLVKFASILVLVEELYVAEALPERCQILDDVVVRYGRAAVRPLLLLGVELVIVDLGEGVAVEAGGGGDAVGGDHRGGGGLDGDLLPGVVLAVERRALGLLLLALLLAAERLRLDLGFGLGLDALIVHGVVALVRYHLGGRGGLIDVLYAVEFAQRGGVVLDWRADLAGLCSGRGGGSASGYFLRSLLPHVAWFRGCVR
jgi:hypothetical protein